MKRLTAGSLVATFALVAGVWAGTSTTARGPLAGATETTIGASETAPPDASSPPPGDDLMSILANDPLSGAPGSGLTRGVSDDSIKVGCVYNAAGYAGYEDGARARFERANRDGGIHGRTIDFGGCEDDAADPIQFTSLVTQLVEQDEVFAVLAEGAGDQAAFDYMNENEVPYFGWGYLPGYCGTRWGFGWNGCLAGPALPDAVPHATDQTNLAQGLIAAADLTGSEARVAIQADDSPSAAAALSSFTGPWEAAGAEIVYNEATLPIPSPTDFTPFVQPLLDSEPNVVILSMQFASVGGYAATLRASGYEGVIVNFVTYVPGLLDAAPQLAEAIDGTYVSTQLVPQEQQTPYVQLIEADLAAIEAENGTFITLGGALGYAEANTLVGLLEAAGEDLNTATFDEAANTTGVSVEAGAEGGIGTTQWPQSHFIGTDCSAVVLVTDGAYTVAEPFACYESVPIS